MGIYFCEDGGSACDIHGRDNDGNYFTIVEGTGYSTETTGLAFSPDSKFMFVSFQDPGVIWQFWRDDGLPFTGPIVDIKYHGASAQRRYLRDSIHHQLTGIRRSVNRKDSNPLTSNQELDTH